MRRRELNSCHSWFFSLWFFACVVFVPILLSFWIPAAVAISFLYYARCTWVSEWHSALHPWCPHCHPRGDDGGGGVLPLIPRPEPSGFRS